MKALKLSNYFEIIRPHYIFFKITPLKSLRNYNSDKIAVVIAGLYKKLNNQIAFEDKKLKFTAQSKVAYYIYMEKNQIEFYFVVPEHYKMLLKEKISSVWKGICIDEVSDIPMVDKDSVNYYMTYDKSDALSIAADKRNNTLLQALTNTTSVMENGDKIAVLYNFRPCNQKTWKADYDYAIKKYKQGFPLNKDHTNSVYLLKLCAKIISLVFESVLGAINSFLNVNKKDDDYQIYIQPLTPETLRKREQTVLSTQIAISSSSINGEKKQAKINAVACCEAFGVLDDDNTLVYKPCRKMHSPVEYSITNEDIKITAHEAQNFISLPAKEIIEEHHIKCIDTYETQVPEPLKHGNIRLGKSMYRGIETDVYMCNDKEYKKLPLCITGATRSGKTTYMENLTNDFLKAGECVIAFDFCGSCEFTERLSKTFKNNTLIIDCSDSSKLQGLGYNEIQPSTDIFEQYRNSKMQSMQLSTLINACNEEDKSLKAKMDRYLEAAALVTFISGGSINDVFQVLQHHQIRHKFIEKVPINQQDNLYEYSEYLSELDEVDKKTGEVTGTVYRKIEGVIDRLNALKKNAYIEIMLKTSCKNNFNLLDEIQKNQLICVKMPEDMFTTKQERDIFCTYWFSKLWLALQIRKNALPTEQHIKVNIMIDEMYQVEHCQALVSQKLSQMAKFTAKLIVSCHYLNQKEISNLREELKSCNSTYCILQGSNVANFESLKNEFINLNYSVEDLMNLKLHNSLNLVSYENGYWAGITSLPKPL